ncbi:uncharacterized protein LOC142343251 isoform X3 [Convolutriloba macropyga]
MIDMEGPMKRQELPGDESVSLRVALNKPPPGGVYWETGSKEYSFPEPEYKKVSNTTGNKGEGSVGIGGGTSTLPMPSKLYSASEKAHVARVSTALADAQISGKTFQELFGDRRRKKKEQKQPQAAIMQKSKTVRPAITYSVQPSSEFKIIEHLPPPREVPEIEEQSDSEPPLDRVPNATARTAIDIDAAAAEVTHRSSRMSQRSSNHFDNFHPANYLSVSTNRSITSLQLNDDPLLSARVLNKPPEVVKTGPERSESKTGGDMGALENVANSARIKLFSERSHLSPLLEIKQLETGRLMEESFNIGTSRSLGELAGNEVPTVDDLLGDINLSIEHTYRELCDSGVLDDSKLNMFKPKQPKQRITTTKFTKADVGIVDPKEPESGSEDEQDEDKNNTTLESNLSSIPEQVEPKADDEHKSKVPKDEAPKREDGAGAQAGLKDSSRPEMSQKSLPMDIQEFLIRQLPEGDVRCFAPSKSQLHKMTMYQNLPAKFSKTMRVYLCCTGDDLKYEKETILYGSIPEVQAYCKSKGLDLQVIDLSDSYLDTSYMFDPDLVKVRMSELEHCMLNSFAVSSVFLIGEKYGYTPLKRVVLKSDLELLLQYMDSYEDKQLVFMVYELDYNSEPVTYVFEDENVFTVFKESLPQEQSMKMNKFDLQKLVHKTLTTAFQLAAEKAFQAKVFTYEQKMKYFMSVLEHEVRKAAPAGKKLSNDSLLFVRRFMENNSQNMEVLETYFDISPEGYIDKRRRELLDNLVYDVIEHNYPSKNVTKFNVKWNSRVGVDPEFIQEQAYYLQDLNAKFIDNMKRVIDEKLAALPRFRCPELEEEKLTHLLFGKRLTDYHCGTATLFRKITTFLEIPDPKNIYIITGKPKFGLSTLAASLASEARDYLPAGTVLSIRFAQATAKSRNAPGLMLGILKEICLAYNKLDDEMLEQIDSCETLTKSLFILEKCFKTLPIDSEHPLLIVIDGLNHLSSDKNAHALHWLPTKLPAHVSLVVTCATGDLSKTLLSKYANSDSSNVFNFPGPSIEDIGDSIHFQLIENYSRTLSEIQMEVVAKALVTNQDLHQMEFVVHQTKSWTHAHDTKEFEEVMQLFKHEVKYFVDDVLALKPALLSRKIMQYLVLFKDYGLSEIELRTVLSYDQELLKLMYRKAPKSHCSVVPIRDSVMSKIFYVIRKFLCIETREGLITCRLPEGALRTELEARFKSKSSKEVDELFSNAVKYLTAKEVIQEPITTLEYPANSQKELVAYCSDFAAGGNSPVRLLSILPMLLLSAKQYEEAKEKCLFNYDFIVSKMTNCSVTDLLKDFSFALSHGIVFASVILDFLHFLRSRNMTRMRNVPLIMISKLLTFEQVAPDVFQPLLDGARSYIHSTPGFWLIPKLQCHVPCASFLRNTFTLVEGTFWETIHTGGSTLICRTAKGIQEFDVDTQERLWSINVETSKFLLSADKKYLVVVTVAKQVQHTNQQGKVKETRTLIVYDARTLNQLASRTMFNNYKCITLAKDSKHIFVGVPRQHQRENSKVYMLKIDTLQNVKVFETVVTVTVVEDIPQQKSILIGGDHNDECVVKMKIDKDVKNFVRGLKGPIIHLHATESGTMAIVGLGMNAIALIDLKKSRIITQQLLDSTRWMTVMRPNKHDKFVVCGDVNPGVIVFDCVKGERVNRLCPSNRDTNIVDATLSDNGQYCVIADNFDNSVSVWHCQNGFCLKTLRGLKVNISSICMIGKSTHIVAASISGEVGVWNVSSLFKSLEAASKKGSQQDNQAPSGDEKRVLLEQNLALNIGKNVNNILSIVTTEIEDQTAFSNIRSQIEDASVVLINQKENLITTSMQHGFQVWDIFTGLPCGALPVEEKTASYTPVFLFTLPNQPNIDQKVCGIYNEKLYIWDVSTRKMFSTVRIQCKFGAMSKDKKFYVTYSHQSISNSAKVTLWNLSPDKVDKISLYEIPNVDFADVKRIVSSHDGQFLVLLASNNWDTSLFVQVYENKTGKNLVKSKYLNSTVDGCFVLAKTLVCTHLLKDSCLAYEVFSIDSGKVLLESTIPEISTHLRCKFLSKGEVNMLLGFDDGQVFKFDTAAFKTGKDCTPLFKLQAHDDKVSALALSNNEMIFATGSTDGWIKLWNFETAEAISSFNCMIDVFQVQFCLADSAIVAFMDSAVCRRMAILAVTEIEDQNILEQSSDSRASNKGDESPSNVEGQQASPSV